MTALTKSRKHPFDFKFDMRFLESLTLPGEIVLRKDMELVVDLRSTLAPVKFHNTVNAITHCQEGIQG